MCFLFCSIAAEAQTYGTLQPSTLSCTRSSIAFGNAVLPACIESKAATLDSVAYYFSAYCSLCAGNETLIAIDLLRLNIGLANGPCTLGVGWNFTGGVFGTGSGAYIAGTLSAQSSVAFARIASSIDCNGIPSDTGPNGSRLQCV